MTFFFRSFFVQLLSFFYPVIKNVLFLFDAEVVHTQMVKLGEVLGKISPLRFVLQKIFAPRLPQLSQKIAGIEFGTPVGLAAGFDYEARLTQTLYWLGFGFQSIGTISNSPCAGNPKPRLGRLPRSKSLLVNKGFKNPGAYHIIQKLRPTHFHIPVGVSIGQTNLKKFSSLEEVITDIVTAFQKFEQSSLEHHYYELNISCPNLNSHFNFYKPSNLKKLLKKIDQIKLKKPLFVKMPISESDATILALLRIISQHSPAGIIIGNLQKDRFDPAVVASERDGLGKGNLSGKPTFNRSNHLISLTYQNFHPRLVIIGCGGVFSAQDAFLKMALGASLVQLITGMIYEGPQLVSQINLGLIGLLKQNNLSHISEVIGINHNLQSKKKKYYSTR